MVGTGGGYRSPPEFHNYCLISWSALFIQHLQPAAQNSSLLKIEDPTTERSDCGKAVDFGSAPGM